MRTKVVAGTNGARAVLDELENRLEAADAALAHAQWCRQLGYSTVHGTTSLLRSRIAVLAEGRARAALRQWDNLHHDPVLTRRVEVLMRRAHWDEVEFHPQVVKHRNRIDAANAKYRFRANGSFVTRAERLATLRGHPSRERRRHAWLSLRSAFDLIEDDVRRLMQVRQRLAREFGFASYPAWVMDATGLDPLWVDALFHELLRSTESIYRDWLGETARVLKPLDGLQPWDLTFAAAQDTALPERAFPRNEAVSAAKATAELIGFGQSSRRMRVDTVPLSHTALCYAVRPPDDVRILVDVQDGHAVFAAVFHEFGHALHWLSLRPESPVLRHEPAPFNESMACLWARFASEPSWLLARGALCRNKVRAYQRASARRSILRLRWQMAQATFEHRAYESLDGDLEGLWCDVYQECLGVPFEQTPGWAGGLLWSSHPFYEQNYVIGEAVASQTLWALKRQFGTSASQEIGPWLITHLFEKGALVPWRDKVKDATGAAVNAEALLADLCADV